MCMWWRIAESRGTWDGRGAQRSEQLGAGEWAVAKHWRLTHSSMAEERSLSVARQERLRVWQIQKSRAGHDSGCRKGVLLLRMRVHRVSNVCRPSSGGLDELEHGSVTSSPAPPSLW